MVEMRGLRWTPRRRSPALTLAAALALALVPGACGRTDAPGAAGARAAGSSPAGSPASAGTPAAAASSGSGAVEFYPAAELARTAASLGKSTGRTLGEHPTYRYIEGHRTADGVPEVHDRWIDLTLVQAGRALLVTGGRVAGGRLESPGEHRGGTIEGGTSRRVAPGDVFVIPAGVPHQYRITPGDSLRYFTVKVLSGSGGR